MFASKPAGGGRLPCGVWAGVTVTVTVAVLALLLPAVQGTTLSEYTHMEEYNASKDSGAPPSTVWYNGSYQYIPAPPGTRPQCARSGKTFCNQVSSYPSEIIERLLMSWNYDLSSAFVDERPGSLTSDPPQSRARVRPAVASAPARHSVRPPFAALVLSAAARAAKRRQHPISFKHAPSASRRTAPPLRRSAPLYSSRAASDRHGQLGFSYSRHKRETDSSEGTQLCPTRGQYVTPKVGLNIRGEWRFLVNMDDVGEQFTQLVRTERCISDRCSGLCSVPSGMEARCQQQYVQKKMVGLDPSGTQIYTDVFWLPHCCVCQIR